jgi:hypothetical protein
LFAGAGGLMLGLERAGFSTLVANEFHPHPCLTLKRNFPKVPVIEGSIRDLTGRTLLEKAGLSVIAKFRAPSRRDKLPLRHSECGFSVAAFGRKPPSKIPVTFAALCRDAATSGWLPRSKAPEGWRTPRRSAFIKPLRISARFWTAAALCRFEFSIAFHVASGHLSDLLFVGKKPWQTQSLLRRCPRIVWTRESKMTCDRSSGQT